MSRLGKSLLVFLFLGALCFIAPMALSQEKETGTTETEKGGDAASGTAVEPGKEATTEGEKTGEVPPEEVTVGEPAEEKTAEEIAAEVEEEMAVKEGETTAEDEMLAEKNKQEAAGHFEKAIAAREAKSLGEAVAELQQARELDPDNATYTEQLKVVQAQYIKELLDSEDYAGAISAGEKHLEMFPDDVTVKNFVTQAKELQEGVATEVIKEETKETITPPTMEEPRTPSELYSEAKALYSLKDYDECRKLLEKAMELDPSNFDIKLLLWKTNEQLYRQAWQTKRAYMKSLLTEVDIAWMRRPRSAVEVPMDLAEPPEKAMPESRKRIMDKLNTIIPKVEFNDAKLKEVIDYLSKKVDVSIVIDEGVFRAGPSMVPTTSPFGTMPGEMGPFSPGTGFPGGTSMPGTGFPGTGSTTPSAGTGFPGEGGLTPPTPDTGFPGEPGTGVDTTGTGMDTGFPTTDMTTAVTQPVEIGGITIALKDVPLKEVLRYVLRMKELKYVVDDYAIVIMRAGDVLPEDLITEIFRLSTSGLGPSSSLGGGGATSFARGTDTGGGFGGGAGGGGGFGGGTSPFSTSTGGGYGAPTGDTGGAETIKDFLLSSGVQWPRGSSIIYHQPTATLIVKNTPTQLALIRELIRIYDTPPMQVEIEARFVEVQLTKLFENSFKIGMDNALTFARKSDLLAGKPLTSIERINTLFDPRSTMRDGKTVKGTSGTIFSISGILTEPEFSIVWNALDQNQYSELLNAPKVTTISGQQAQIQVVEEIRYPTDFEVETLEDIFIDTATVDLTGFTPFFVNPTNFETREVGTLLTVTPTVSADGRVITLVLFPEVSELLGWDIYGGSLDLGGAGDDSGGGTGTGSTFSGLQAPQPRFGSRNITTTVYVNDGETIVLGGLITERASRYKDKVPIFGSIPFIGRLFRTELDDSFKRNLIIFVTARLITSRGTELKEERRVTEMLHARTEEAKKKAAEETEGRMPE